MRGQALEHTPMRRARGEIVASLEHEFPTVRRAESLPAAVTGSRRWQRAGFLVAQARMLSAFTCATAIQVARAAASANARRMR